MTTVRAAATNPPLTPTIHDTIHDTMKGSSTLFIFSSALLCLASPLHPMVLWCSVALEAMLENK